MTNKKRGFTLLELTIVLAVVAIMTTGIVTLCASVKGLSDRTKSISTALNDVATVRKQTTMWLSYFDTADWTITVGDGETSADGSTTGSTEDPTKTRLTATHVSQKVTDGNGEQQPLTCRLYIDYIDNKQCKLVCEYPTTSDNLLNEDYTGEVTVTEYEFTALRFVHFQEVKDGKNVTWTEKNDSGNDTTTSGTLNINGKTAYVCTVSYFDTDGNGSMNRKEMQFVVVTKTAKAGEAGV